MGVEVKICGVTEPAAVDAALAAGADYLGLVFHPASPRYLALEQASSLAARARGRTRLVALLVDPDDARLAGVLEAMKPDFVQLHGRETPERLGAIRSRFAVSIIKSFSIAEAADLAPVARYGEVADLFLFDAKAPKGADRPGGHGAAFDWRLLRGHKFPRPWLLAGGLNSENVARAIETSGAPGVDVSSGVETAPGIKDRSMIAAFVAAARHAHYAKPEPEPHA